MLHSLSEAATVGTFQNSQALRYAADLGLAQGYCVRNSRSKQRKNVAEIRSQGVGRRRSQQSAEARGAHVEVLPVTCTLPPNAHPFYTKNRKF